MLGAIIGDIVGSRFEFNNHRSKDFELFTEDCFATDDSIMTIAVAKAIMETASERNKAGDGFKSDDYRRLSHLTVKYLQKIGQRYPDCGYGGMFFGWMFDKNPKPYNSFGNGAAMRISPAAYAACTESAAIRTAISLGGDSDTIGAITGAIAEAYYGVPQAIKEKALTYLDKKLRVIYDDWLDFVPDCNFISIG